MDAPKFYASLIGPLIGLYMPMDYATENACREALNSSKLSALWCAVYTREDALRHVTEYNVILLPDKWQHRL